ncbi:MAG TPA: hypothetical protein GXX46_01335 [Peptococcaceae bacterium]|nr:hypothetical protein [Peptococcaceae bacterium]
MEKNLLRVMVLCAVLLAVFQLKSFTNPVDFYLKVMGDLDSPAFKYEEYISGGKSEKGQGKTISLYLQSEPASPVIVKQNEKNLGTIGRGLTIEAEPGTVYLDASHLAYPVTVEIILNDKSYYLELDRDIKSFEIGFAPKAF